MAVRIKNIINKSFKSSGISDFNITAPVSVKNINWDIDKAPIINWVIWAIPSPDTIIDGKNISVNPTSTAGAASIALGIWSKSNTNTIG